MGLTIDYPRRNDASIKIRNYGEAKAWNQEFGAKNREYGRIQRSERELGPPMVTDFCAISVVFNILNSNR